MKVKNYCKHCFRGIKGRERNCKKCYIFMYRLQDENPVIDTPEEVVEPVVEEEVETPVE